MSDQLTSHRQLKTCGGCSRLVLHHQVATFASSGFKSYELVPVEHRRPNGQQCAFKSDLRTGAWSATRRGV